MEELTDLGYRFKEFTNTLEGFGEFDFIVIKRVFGENRNILRTLFYYKCTFRYVKVQSLQT